LSAVVLACLAAPRWTVAQQPPDKQDVPGELTPEEKFWFSTPRRRVATAAEMVLVRDPFLAMAIRIRAKEHVVWGLELDGDVFQSLNADWLEDITDGRPLPDFRGKAPDRIAKSDLAMYQAYCQALILANQQPVELFRKAAKDDEAIKFSHLWNDPANHRGRVITIKGRMARLRKHDPAPRMAQQEGVKHVYESWIFGDTKNAYPFACVFPVLPDGLEPSESMDRRVTFYGYFLGQIKVRVGTAHDPRDEKRLLLIGPTVLVERAGGLGEGGQTPFSFVVLVGVAGLVFGLTVIVFSLNWWFRKGDQAIQRQLAERKQQQVLDALAQGEAWPTAAEPGPTGQTGITAPPADQTGLTVEPPDNKRV
jgi:hypothetical protein